MIRNDAATRLSRSAYMNICAARQSLFRGDIEGTLRNYNIALRSFIEFTSIPAGTGHLTEQLHEQLRIEERDLQLFPMEEFVKKIGGGIRAGITSGKRAVVITGPSSAGKNILSEALSPALSLYWTETSVIDVDRTGFVKRGEFDERFTFDSQLAGRSRTDLSEFVASVDRSLSETDAPVILPVFDLLLHKLPLDRWPVQVIEIKPKNPGSRDIAFKMFRKLLFKDRDPRAGMEWPKAPFYLDILDPTIPRELSALARPDHVINPSTGEYIISGGKGAGALAEGSRLDVLTLNPFFGIWSMPSRERFLSDYISSHDKMRGIYEFWKESSSVDPEL